ncbi:hypothetical protein DPMN_084429 [Dreissena polymorpha]|uniref:Uncharacterized protein n=1 Tax=Dreissena polymorpha TaxID=45954 RepID=A0A9D3YEJ4_DREPO|nr:hypothetical protein DPMN_084429 [Dreissena polymorpha]
MSYSNLPSNQDELTPPATRESTQPETARRDRPSTTKSESKLYLKTPEDFVNSVKQHAKPLREDFHRKLNSVKTVREITYSAKPYRTYKKRSDETTTDEQPKLQPVSYPISTQKPDSNKLEGPNQLENQTSITFIPQFHPHLTEGRQDPLPEPRHQEGRTDPTFEPTTTDLLPNTRFEPPPYGDFHRRSDDPSLTDDQLPILSREHYFGLNNANNILLNNPTTITQSTSDNIDLCTQTLPREPVAARFKRLTPSAPESQIKPVTTFRQLPVSEGNRQQQVECIDLILLS